jgi:hypothetical protein
MTPKKPMTPEKMERLLEDFANVKPGDDVAMERWCRIYGSALPASFFQDIQDMERREDEILEHYPMMANVVNRGGRTDSEIRQAALSGLHGLAHQLRHAWDANLEDREWYTYELRRWISTRTEPARSHQVPMPPPTDTGLQQALKYFQQRLDFAKYCGHPRCKARYFFAEDSRSKYCDDPKCARWGVLHSKKMWARKTRSAKKKGTR